MTLRTVAIPDPAAGADWSTVVPGRYLYDVTGITATLDTGGPTPTVAADSSGNGRDGTYKGGAASIVAPGLLPAGGDAALDCSRGTSGVSARNWVQAPGQTFDWAAPWSWECWVRGTIMPLFGMITGTPFVAGSVTITITTDGLGNDFVWCLTADPASTWKTDYLTIADGDPHHVVVTYDGAAVAFYFDGAPVTLASTGNPMDVFTPTVTNLGANDQGTRFAHGFVDEIAIYDVALPDIIVDQHYALGSVSFAAYTAAVLGQSPFVYYHLDDVSGGARQVCLVVATSTGTVADIDTGFPVATGAGPYQYSWQPHLQAGTQTPDGSTTTVPIPRLILPAGYTIGSSTLDLATTDQWSDITLWWDDTQMLAGGNVNPYIYPPGVKLVYRPTGATP